MAFYLIGQEEDIPEGGRKVVECDSEEIGVFRIKGKFVAWRNRCPHRQGPICQGKIYPRVIEPLDENMMVRTLDYDYDRMNIVCPWHGWEFNLETGESFGNPRMRLLPVKVSVREGAVYVEL